MLARATEATDDGHLELQTAFVTNSMGLPIVNAVGLIRQIVRVKAERRYRRQCWMN